MRQREISRWPSGVVSVALIVLVAGAPAAASDLLTFESDASVQFRLSGDGKWLAYTIFEEGPPSGSTLVDNDGVTSIMPGVVNGISFDGSVITGTAYNPDAGYYQGYVLEDGVSRPIADFIASGDWWLHYSRPTAVSRDGNVVIGQAAADTGWGHAFRWSDGVLTDLGLLSGAVSSNAVVLSRDGSVITGDSHVGENDIAVVWANGATTPTALGSLGGIGSYAFAISADGSTIVGRADTTDPAQFIHAYRWTQQSGMVDLGVFDGGDNSEANAVSADGSVVVGSAEIAPGQMRAFRWVEADGALVDLGSLGGSNKGSGAYAVSDDGRVVVGGSDLAGGGTTGFRWDAQHGMQSIADFLTDAGLDVSGWTFDRVGAISADGHSMAGIGNANSPSGVWYARCIGVEDDQCGLIAPEDIGQSFASVAALGQAGNSYLEGDFAALGNVLANAGPGASATAYGAYDSDPATSAGIVVTTHPGDAFTAAFGLGTAHIETPLGFGGSAGFDAVSFSAALGLLPADGLTLRLSATGALLDGAVARGYLNGNTPVTSSGDTTGSGSGVEGLIGWRAGGVLPDTTLLAYASFGIARTDYAGWTEHGGPFPGSIGGFATTTTLLRAGVNVDHEFGGGISARGGLALVHRESSDTPISGALPGVLSTTLDVSGTAADWVELSGGLTLPLESVGELEADLMARAPLTGPPSVTAQLGLRLPL